MDRSFLNDLLEKINLKSLDTNNLSVNAISTEVLCLYFAPQKDLVYIYAPLLKVIDSSLSQEFLIKVLGLNTPTKNDLNLRYGLLNNRLWQSVTLNALQLENLQFSLEDFLKEFLKALTLARESLLEQETPLKEETLNEDLKDIKSEFFNNPIIWG